MSQIAYNEESKRIEVQFNKLIIACDGETNCTSVMVDGTEYGHGTIDIHFYYENNRPRMSLTTQVKFVGPHEERIINPSEEL